MNAEHTLNRNANPPFDDEEVHPFVAELPAEHVADAARAASRVAVDEAFAKKASSGMLDASVGLASVLDCLGKMHDATMVKGWLASELDELTERITRIREKLGTEPKPKVKAKK